MGAMMKLKYLKAIIPILLMGVALIAYARSNGEPENLLDAAVADDAASVTRLIAQGADPNQRSQHGNTALMIGAAWGSMNAVAALLDHGADIRRHSLGGRGK